jgi:putative hydrolase of the HAD superfamily
MQALLDRIDCWIFDLDNTLYPASCDLFGLIDRRMTAYVARLTGLPGTEALALQKSYFHAHGTTLSGLMANHGVDPHDFLREVHDVEMDALAEDRRLIEALAKLPGRKLVFTNGDGAYAARVLERLGLGASFEAIHDIHAMAYVPKPEAASYASMLAALRVDPARALFAEDMARNLRPAKALGMTTLWVDNGSDQAGQGGSADFIDYRTDDLGAWLAELTGEQA